MIVLNKQWDFKKTSKKITELTALYYAAKYEDYISDGKNRITIYPSGHIYDIAVEQNIRTNDPNTIKKQHVRFIEVKGTNKTRPQSTRVYKSIHRLPAHVSPSRYLFYVVYNICKNCSPGLAIFGWDYFEEASHKGRDGTWHILGVNKAAKKGRISDFPRIFENYSREKGNGIIDFFKGTSNKNKEIIDNKVIVPKVVQQHTDSGALRYEDANDIELKEIYDDLLTYLSGLGNDVRKEYEERRLSYSSISRRNNKRINLVRIYPASRKAWTIWLRKETIEAKYPPEINNLSEYTSEKDSKDLGFAHFKLKDNSDLEIAKRMLKFAYDNL